MIDDIFFAALAYGGAEERSAYLEQACASNPELRRRVERLLEAHVQNGSFLEAPAPELRPTVDQPVTESSGTLVGPYKLIEPIGEGGMGAVWMAQQTEPVKRLVALKLIKAGMDSKQIIVRFEAERQALALMDHTNIARVFDAGTTAQGRPYFVMELVKGKPITRYCDEHRLTPRQRLELFLPVCRAVQHAHQKGIIHRDLKPSNVLVPLYDGKPVPKVIDFGVAKATGQQLTEKTLVTGFGAIVGTLEYMSPEQAEVNQLDIDTRSDVYSLGVLLYELLTGSPPFSRKELEKAGVLEMLRMIREREPSRPSTKLSTAEGLPTLAANRGTEPAKLTRLVRGELDWIVMKALEKDRSRRYETANGFAQDIQRYLADDPVLACPPSQAYRLKKFLRRNKGPVIAVALVVLALVGGVTGTTLGLIRAIQAEGETGRTLTQVADERDAKEKARAEAVANAQRADEETGKTTAALTLAKEDRDRARFQALRAADARHAVQLVLVQRAVESGDMAEANRVLAAVDEPFRDTWEQRHLASLARSRVREVTGHTKPITGIALSPDGTLGVSVSEDDTVRVWDAAGGRELHCLPGHRALEAVAFSPDGKWFATGGAELILWEAATARKLHTLKVKAGVFGLAFSPDSRSVAASYGFQEAVVRLWDVANGELKGTFDVPAADADHVAFSPDGKFLAVGGAAGGAAGSATVWDLATGKVQRTFPKTYGQLHGLDFSPDSKSLAAAHLFSATAWDVATGKEQYTLEAGARLQTFLSIRYSPDGGRLATGNTDGVVRLWEAGSGRPLTPLSLHGALLSHNPVAFSGDGHFLAACGQYNTILVWELDAARRNPVHKIHQYPVYCAASAPDGKWVATAADTRGFAHLAVVGWAPPGAELKVWDPATGAVRQTLKYPLPLVNSLAVSPDGLRLAAAGGAALEGVDAGGRGPGQIVVWDVGTGQEQLAIKTDSGPFASVAFSPDGSRLLSICSSGEIRVYDAKTGDHCFSHKTRSLGLDGMSMERLRAAAFSPDGRLLAAAGTDAGVHGPVAVWEVATGKEKLSLPVDDQATFVTFSPDGCRIATSDPKGTVKLWDTATGAETATLKGHAHSVVGLAFSVDGTRLATASTGAPLNLPGELRLWNPKTGEGKLALKAHAGAVNAVCFTADGRLISVGKDGTTRVWNAPK
jgi:WD40 repeat protein/serine/threonine protein kinase